MKHSPLVLTRMGDRRTKSALRLQRVGGKLARYPVKSPIEILFRELLTLSMRAHDELEVTPQLLGWGTKKALRSTEAELLPR